MLNYKTYGEHKNQALLIIHGLFGSLDNWMSLAKQWSKDHFVLTIDVRNHGRSFHKDSMTFEEICDDILEVLDSESIKKVDVIGHSMGGKIAMDFAANHPSRLNKLIIVDVAPYEYSPHHSEVFNMLDKLEINSYSSRQDIEMAIRDDLKDEGVVQFISKNVRRNEYTHHFEWKFNYPVLRREYEYLITRIPSQGFNGNVLFIGGDRSNYINKETSGRIFDLYPNFELEYVSDSGHWVHVDNPTEFYNKVNDFINK